MTTDLAALDRLPADYVGEEEDLIPECMCTNGVCYPDSTSNSVQH